MEKHGEQVLEKLKSMHPKHDVSVQEFIEEKERTTEFDTFYLVKYMVGNALHHRRIFFNRFAGRIENERLVV